jgi:hypothetical protein
MSGVAGALALGDDRLPRSHARVPPFVDRLMERCEEGLTVRKMFVAVKIPCSRNHSAS